MRFMILLKADKRSESGQLPNTQLLAAMGKYNEALVNAGVLVAGEGLHPSMEGVRVHFKGNQRSVSEGPFQDKESLIAGYWVFDVASREEAVDWVKRCPFPFDEADEAEIEIRQIYTTDEFDTNLTPELKKTEQQLRRHLHEQDMRP
jgi:hypothetical protein